MKKVAEVFVILCAVVSTSWAARVDTVFVQSASMGKKVEVVYIVPDKACGEHPQAVCSVYLLHGYAGNARSWITMKPELPAIADEKGMLFICPDGQNSWYWDSPKNSGSCYETFVATELVAYTDARYATLKDRKARAIAGLSMGGHGALWLSIRHKDIFGAAGSMSGGLDIRPFPDNWKMKEQLGEYEDNKALWDAHTVACLSDSICDGELALIIDCGVDDFFLEVNEAFHRSLVAKKVGHDFIVRPGAHTVAYWNNAVDYQLLFFEKYFRKNAAVAR